MTKKVLLVIGLLMATVFCFAISNAIPVKKLYLQMVFEAGYNNPTPTHPQKPKTPMRAPEVYQDDHTLTFSYNNGYTLELVDTSMGDEGTVVYLADIPEDVLTWQLPSSLSGNYTIRLRYGNWTFVGEIEL